MVTCRAAGQPKIKTTNLRLVATFVTQWPKLDHDDGRVTDNGLPKVDCPVVVAKETEDWQRVLVATSHLPHGRRFLSGRLIGRSLSCRSLT